VHLSRLLGANKRYLETHLPHIGDLLEPELDAVIDESDVLVLGQAGASVEAALRRRSRADQVIVDLVRLANRDGVAARVEGLCW
jgi:GDP-mannose 6-dehydrogenase